MPKMEMVPINKSKLNKILGRLGMTRQQLADALQINADSITSWLHRDRGEMPRKYWVIMESMLKLQSSHHDATAPITSVLALARGIASEKRETDADHLTDTELVDLLRSRGWEVYLTRGKAAAPPPGTQRTTRKTIIDFGTKKPVADQTDEQGSPGDDSL